MTILGVIEKRRNDRRAKIEKQQKLVNDLREPERVLEELLEQDAQDEREEQAHKEQLQQLHYELADDERWLEDVTPHIALLTSGIGTLAALEQLIVSRVPIVYQLDIDQYEVNRLWAVVKAVVEEQVPARQARAESLRQRIKELGGE